MNLSERIKTMLAERNSTKAELARIAGVTKTAAGLWESGTTQSIAYENAKRIEAAWGYSADWIISDKKPKHSAKMISKEMADLIEMLIEIDVEGGPQRDDVIFLLGKLLPMQALKNKG